MTLQMGEWVGKALWRSKMGELQVGLKRRCDASRWVEKSFMALQSVLGKALERKAWRDKRQVQSSNYA